MKSKPKSVRILGTTGLSLPHSWPPAPRARLGPGSSRVYARARYPATSSPSWAPGSTERPRVAAPRLPRPERVGLCASRRLDGAAASHAFSGSSRKNRDIRSFSLHRRRPGSSPAIARWKSDSALPNSTPPVAPPEQQGVNDESHSHTHLRLRQPAATDRSMTMLGVHLGELSTSRIPTHAPRTAATNSCSRQPHCGTREASARRPTS